MNLFLYHDFFCLVPELFVGLFICFCLFFGSIFSQVQFSFFKKSFSVRKTFFWLVLEVLFFTFFLLINNPADFIVIFFGCFVYDYISFVGKISLVFLTFVILCCSFNFLKFEVFNCFEFFILFLIGLLGLFLIISAFDFLIFYLALELQALSFYALATFKNNSAFSTEAGLKYFIIGAFSSGIFLFGCSFIYGISGSTSFSVLTNLFSLCFVESNFFSFSLIFGLVCILVAFIFKLSAAPFHFWSPDVYEGSPLFVSTFFSLVPKLAFLIILVRVSFICFFSLFFLYQSFFLVSSFFCFCFGVLGAITQKKLKRFFVYSSIGHFGFILLAFACSSFYGIQSLFFYIFFYLIMASFFWLNFFCFFSSCFNQVNLKFLDEFEGLIYENPVCVFLFIIILFSIAGVPPLAGFFIKFYVFVAAFSSNFYFFVFVIICFSVASTFYYLRFVRILCFLTDFQTKVYRSKCFFSKFSFLQSFFIVNLSFLVVFFFNFFQISFFLFLHRFVLVSLLFLFFVWFLCTPFIFVDWFWF